MSKKKKKSKKYLEDYNYKNTVEDSEEGNGSYDDCFFIGTATSSNDENHEDNGEDTEVEHQAIENEDDSENESDSSDGPLIIDINLGNEDENYEDDGEDTEEEHQAIDNKDASENESDSSDGPLIIDINLGNEEEDDPSVETSEVEITEDVYNETIDTPCNQVTEHSSCHHKRGHVAAEQAPNEFLVRKEAPLLTQKEPRKDINIPSPYTLSKMVIRRYHACVYKNTLYVIDKEKKYYVKSDEGHTMGLVTANLGEDYLIKIPVKYYKDVYTILVNNLSLVKKNIEIPSGHVLFENGMFNVFTGEYVAGPPSTFCIYKVNSRYRRYYDDTPVFDAFLESVSGGNYQIKRRILEFIGYCLIPDMEGKCFFILGTASDSGKSVLGKFLKRLFGADVISNVPLEDFGKTFALAPIVGKHLNLAMDLSGGLLNKNDVSYIKQLTGEDDISLQAKYVNAFSHTNTAKFVFATNEPIHCKKDDPAFWNRMIIVPFIRSIPKKEQNKHLLDDLWAERTSIVTKAILAIRDVYYENYVFSDCLVAERMKIQWRWHEIADVLSFVIECCDLTDPSARTTVSELYTSYCNFCDENDIEEREMKGFSQTLKNHFNLKSFKGAYNSHNLRGYKGIKLKSQV